MSRTSIRCWTLFLLLAASPLVGADAPTAEQAQFFESKVRPLLVARCQKCHGAESPKSGLRVDSLNALLAGGDFGPAIVPGKPAESLLLAALRYQALEMPPDGRLPPDQVAAVEQWIRDGALWPGEQATGQVVRRPGLEITATDRDYWAFRPVRAPAPPVLDNTPATAWVRNPIDAFIAARLVEAGLEPAMEATPRELARRLAFDLTGLPPTPEELDAFDRETDVDAFERRVDDLLARPGYGERWGRHWLDVVRFAQTNGYERDDEKPNAWRYRDYVVRAFNGDKPYDQFVREQIAGDELDEQDDDTRTATGFFRLGVWDDEPDDARQAEFDNLDDMLSVTGSAFLGITIGCARCHDHKFDPLAQEDYYGLLAFLRNVRPFQKPGNGEDESIFRPVAGGKALSVHERAGAPPATHVLLRGDAGLPGAEVPPRFPRVLCPEGAGPPEIEPLPGSSGRRRVLAAWLASPDHPLVARVIVNRLWQHHFGRGLVATPNDLGSTGLPPSHPELLDYLAHELVTQGWRLKPIQRLILTSATWRQSSRGDAGAWGLAAASGRPDPTVVDPDNQLLWRQNLRRLEAEAIRDSVLAVSGRLQREMGGRGVFPTLAPEVLATQSRPGSGWDRSTPAEASRRSVYIFVKRTLGVPLLETLDAARPDTSTATRATTTIAPQALMLLNSDFIGEQSLAFAERLLREAPGTGVDSDAARIDAGLRLAVGRGATPAEQALLLSLLERQRTRIAAAPTLAANDAADGGAQWRSDDVPGWSRYGEGLTWSDGGWTAAPTPGGKVIWERLEIADGELACELQLARAGGDCGLLARVTEPRLGTDALVGYNINLAAGRLRLGKHANNWRAIESVAAPIEPGQWVKLRVRFDGARVRVWIGDGERPLIDHVDPEPLPAGKVGFRTFQCAASIREFTWNGAPLATSSRLASSPLATSPLAAPPSAQELAAWSAICKVLLNLNEFVYVD